MAEFLKQTGLYARAEFIEEGARAARHTSQYPFAILEKITVFPAAEVKPPLGVKTNDWIDGWKR